MIETMLQRAHQLMQHNRYKDAERELLNILSIDPNNTSALALLSICKIEHNDLSEASRLIQDAIGKEPANDHFLYIQSLIFIKQDKTKDAEKFIRSAISINPESAEYFGLLATVNLNKKEWQAALEAADHGLSIDASNLLCLNSRSTALFKLDRKDDAYSTIREAISQDPENEVTHTNIGWGLLEKGDHLEALKHFREALRINPNYENAKAGLVQGLKARYWFYRIFLKYSFWLGNMKSKGQWVVIIGLYIGIRILNNLAESNERLGMFLKPIVYIYIAFAISTWIITPLSNLFLRLNVYGRYALTEKAIRASNFVGVSLLIGILGGIVFLFNGALLYLLILIFGVSMMIPLASMFNPEKKSSRNILIGYAIVLGLIGVFVLFQCAVTGGIGDAANVYVIGAIAYGWIANALVMR